MTALGREFDAVLFDLVRQGPSQPPVLACPARACAGAALCGQGAWTTRLGCAWLHQTQALNKHAGLSRLYALTARSRAVWGTAA